MGISSGLALGALAPPSLASALRPLGTRASSTPLVTVRLPPPIISRIHPAMPVLVVAIGRFLILKARLPLIPRLLRVPASGPPPALLTALTLLAGPRPVAPGGARATAPAATRAAAATTAAAAPAALAPPLPMVGAGPAVASALLDSPVVRRRTAPVGGGLAWGSAPAVSFAPVTRGEVRLVGKGFVVDHLDDALSAKILSPFPRGPVTGGCPVASPPSLAGVGSPAPPGGCLGASVAATPAGPSLGGPGARLARGASSPPGPPAHYPGTRCRKNNTQRPNRLGAADPPRRQAKRLWSPGSPPREPAPPFLWGSRTMWAAAGGRSSSPKDRRL